LRGIDHAGPVVGFSGANVLAELRRPGIPAPIVIPGCAGWLAATDFHDLDRLLPRAYRLAKALPHELLHAWQKQVGSLNATEREAITKQRIGQDLFREGLMTLWQGRCAITGLDEPALLRASHAKPWKDASDAERLDVYNGLLLAAHLDAAFDDGLITLDPSGNVVASSALKPAALAVLGMSAKELRVVLAPKHEPYMQWHRNSVFRVR
jgi:predicted restriction endonuclease